MIETVGQSIDELRSALREYIEAAYHVGHPTLVQQRRALLDAEGVIAQQAFIESTPRYVTDKAFGAIGGLDAGTAEMLSILSRPDGPRKRLIVDPPYSHQYRALEEAVVNGRSLVVMTGTGSGKTESFLLPILGKLAREAREAPDQFSKYDAMRCLLLYPMNALVNDQLGRLRLLFGDTRTRDKIKSWSGRPIRFARYTSRTLYPGVRTRQRDQTRLKPIDDYYLHLLEGNESERRLATELQVRGKWPIKGDLRSWYGQPNQRWTDKEGNFIRCVREPDDIELITRHEVLRNPPDILITNYSMLEYMMMRPLERPLLDATKKWLAECPKQSLLLVIDEAHLYRGAAGAEVAYLIRRLTNRLGIGPDRLQVICTSASFGSGQSAEQFAADLTGKDARDFVGISGDLAMRSPARPGTVEEAESLAAVDIARLYESESQEERLQLVEAWLAERGAARGADLAETLYYALESFGPLNELVNRTMKQAHGINFIEAHLFPGVEKKTAGQATATLMALGSLARKNATESGLLPCRAHAFFRGLPGLWVCMDPDCVGLAVEMRGGPCGRLYDQPRAACECGARVLELYTCRACGTAYARAYTDDIVQPEYLWAEPGESFHDASGTVVEPRPVDLLLETPRDITAVEPAEYDLLTGRLNPRHESSRTRTVFLPRDRHEHGIDDPTPEVDTAGLFVPCGVCDEKGRFGRSTVQDHQTKGDQPFQALVTRQIEIQPPAAKASDFAPNRGRKVLIFSDSRQVAARLAPNLQDYSTRDLIRPLLTCGFSKLGAHPRILRRLSLEDAYLAVLIGAAILEVVLRPPLKPNETFRPFADTRAAVRKGVLRDEDGLEALREDVRGFLPPQALLRGIHATLTDKYYGLQALALAFLQERQVDLAAIEQLPDLKGVAETSEQKVALVRLWLGNWRSQGIWFSASTGDWIGNFVTPHNGRFEPMATAIGSTTAKSFVKSWLEPLLSMYCDPVATGKFRLLASKVSLGLSGEWAYCTTCKTVELFVPGLLRCSNCGSENRSVVDTDRDPVFVARKGYYRATTVASLATPPKSPLGIIAAEHTAQIGTAQEGEVYSLAEEHELLFQDVDLGADSSGRLRPAIDVLSCTTTMEVGIDIGQLSGVALRNMPPGRANYQQRAGRAGRRGTSVATVLALAGADSHDNYFFTHAEELVSGTPPDPVISLDNESIAKRHVLAFILQEYLGSRVDESTAADRTQLFEVLGSVADFVRDGSPINRADFAAWLSSAASGLRSQLDRWLPAALAGKRRADLLADLSRWPVDVLDEALDGGAQESGERK